MRAVLSTLARSAFVWCGVFLLLAHGMLFQAGWLWRLPTASPGTSVAYYTHALRGDVDRVRRASSPVLVVLGSSVVGPLSEEVIALSLPDWSVAVVVAAGATADDWVLLTHWVRKAGADALVLGTTWFDLVPAGGQPWPAAEYARAVGRGPQFWRFRDNLSGLVALAWRERSRPYSRHYRREIREPENIANWPKDHVDGYPQIDFGSVIDGSSPRWAGVRRWAAAVDGMPVGLVQMPHNPIFEEAGLIPREVSAACLEHFQQAAPAVPVLDLAGARPAPSFRDALHLQGHDMAVSDAIGKWAARTVCVRR